jgi:6-phosphogluconolactonase (cycloisomerase 2 family)
MQSLKFTLTSRGPNPRQTAPHPHSVFPDPSGKFLLSADLGADLIRIFKINQGTGTLTECPSGRASPGDGPRHGAFWSPPDAKDTDMNMLYTLNELGNSVSSWSVAYAAGDGCLTLTRKQTLSTFPVGKTAPSGAKAAEVHVRDNFVYASNRFDRSFGAQEDSMATFDIDPATGNIKFAEATSARSYFPRTFAINGKGDMVAIGGQTSSNVAIVARNITTGRLGAQIANLKVGNPGSVNQEDGLSAVIWNE